MHNQETLNLILDYLHKDYRFDRFLITVDEYGDYVYEIFSVEDADDERYFIKTYDLDKTLKWCKEFCIDNSDSPQHKYRHMTTFGNKDKDDWYFIDIRDYE